MPRKIKLSYNKNRAILSDYLPFEVPIIFSNREFYRFVSDYEISYSDQKFSWKKCSLHTEAAIKMLLGIKQCSNASEEKMSDEKLKRVVKQEYNQTIPFEFSTLHNKNEMRQLSIFHPRNQIILNEIYEKHKELIIYLCSKSPFSIRYPSSVSKCYIWKSNKNIEKFDDDSIELSDQSYENLRSYFVYKDYSNIFKFYESKKYHECEKLYNKMAKLDISKCFNNIYTHSVAWSIYSKDVAKENLDKKKLSWSFSDQLDKAMQTINHNETNGILIGPETSRIFAEIILQGVDRILLNSLIDNKIELNKDYAIFRYVDDYFIFFNEDSTYNEIAKELQVALKLFKMTINFQKEIVYEKPIITPISIAKTRISKLLSEELNFEIKEQGEDAKTGRIHVDSSSLVTKFKTVIKTSNIDYKDILAFSLSTVEKRLRKALVAYTELGKDPKSQRNIAKAIAEILEFTFFVYSVSPRVNTTIKLCRICQQAIEFIKKENSLYEFKQITYEIIFKNIIFLLKKNSSEKYTQIETLYLLTLSSQLGKLYWLDEETLAEYFGAKKLKNNNYEFQFTLNFFSITTLLFYMKEKVRYSNLRIAVSDYLKEKVFNTNFQMGKRTEYTLLAFDLISCPYIHPRFKSFILDKFGVEKKSHSSIINLRKYWFTRWTEFDLAKELDTKISLEVY
jgi:hypothetical protein